MHHRFSALAARVTADPAAFRREFTAPMLLWAVESSTRTWQLQWLTDRGTGERRPTARDPLVLMIAKRAAAKNAFPGVTVGRTPNNDVVIDDPTVSRFHAYFRQDPITRAWSLCDAESHNGTLLGMVRLAKNRAVPLFERADMRFGDVPVTYFSAEAFEQYVRERQRKVTPLAAELFLERQ